MKQGRNTKEEQARRIKLLVGFLFTFRYATRTQLETFIQLIVNISHTHWLVDYSLKKGFVSVYYEPLLKMKIYYLGPKGKQLISHEAMIEHYHFEKSYAGINTFAHQNAVVEAFFMLKSHLNIQEWICEWALRVGKERREKIPDGLLVFPDGTRAALEVETRYKKLAVLRYFVKRYHYDITRISRYDCVLIISASRLNYEGLKTRLYNIAPELCASRFFLSDLGMLEQGTCLYQNKLIHLEDAFGLLRQNGGASHE
jgi:hypothetical protein